jgi:hypothetical protein
MEHKQLEINFDLNTVVDTIKYSGFLRLCCRKATNLQRHTLWGVDYEKPMIT